MNVPKKTLNNGVIIPMIGLGTWRLEGEVCHDSILHALKAGYTSFDTAKVYENEEYVGRALKDCGVPREELFVTTKLWNTDQGYDNTLKAFEVSMRKLELDVLDLYLVHWPGKTLFKDTWKAMEKLYGEGRIRAIGVSNFMPHHLQALLQSAEVTPAVNQLESHPYLRQRAAEEYCAENGILVEAWSPLMRGETALNDPVIKEIADAHGKTSAQVILNWHVSQGRRIIPRSSNKDRIAENLRIFDFELSRDETAKINSLADKGVRTGPDPEVFF